MLVTKKVTLFEFNLHICLAVHITAFLCLSSLLLFATNPCCHRRCDGVRRYDVRHRRNYAWCLKYI